MKSIVTAALAAAFLAAAPAEAKVIPEMQKFLKDEIMKLDKVSEPTVGEEGGTYAGNYKLSLFRLRLRAELGFDIGVAKVTVEPVAEFFWE